MVRPTYGAADSKHVMKTVAVHAVTSMTKVEGAGMVYGGLVLSVPYESAQNDVVIIAIDGEELTNTSFRGMYEAAVTQRRMWPIYLMLFDNIDFNYCVGISDGMTFEESVEVKYKEVDGHQKNVECYLVYALLAE